MTQTGLIAKRLDGKIAVITGGNSGIGLATAQRFVAEGAYVFINGRRQNEIDTAVNLIGKNVTGIRGDVSNQYDLDRLYDTVKRQKGRIDVLFANAGLWDFGAAFEAEEHFDKIFGVNVKGLLFTVQKSASAVSGWRLDHFYWFGIRTQRIRGVECLQRNQGSYAVVRSFLDRRSETPQDPRQRHQPWSDRHTCLPPQRQRTINEKPPDEVAKAVSFLASDDSSFITGIELFVDGGIAQI